MAQRKNESHQMNIPSSQRHLKKVVAFVEGLAQKTGFSDDVIVDIAISASEAVNNAILHGNKKNRKKKVSILVEIKRDRFIIRVTDQGTAFTPAGICNPLDPENLMKCSGRGILIQKSLMDEVTFRPAPGGGTEVELIKRLPRSERYHRARMNDDG
jgi:serine/threonine-protein kinase RsbW